ncbi:MAG: hypothetical protein U1E76_15930 [Planctomycetota bacterium]
MDRGLRGQGLKGHLHSSTERGTIVFTKSPVLDNVPIMLTHPGIFEALALPLTPFLDSERLGRDLKTVTEADVQPFQKARVVLVHADTGEPVRGTRGNEVAFVGTEPIDIPNCHDCHATGDANLRFPRVAAMVQAEIAYWKSVGASDFYASVKAASISVLGLHDAKHGTLFTSGYQAGATGHRLGRPAVLCQKCHADNVLGVLASARIAAGAGDTLEVIDAARIDNALPAPRIIDRLDSKHPFAPAPGTVVKALSEAIHAVHLALRPLPDAAGRPGACQGCHPAHRADRDLSGYPITREGRNPYDGRAGSLGSDNRDAGGGCFVGRDVHSLISRQAAPSRARLNAIGRFLIANVAREAGGAGKGLWCTNCHTTVSRQLYQADRLRPGRAFAPAAEDTARLEPLEALAPRLGLDLSSLTAALDPRVRPRSDRLPAGLSRAGQQAFLMRGEYDASELLAVYAPTALRKSADLGIILHFLDQPFTLPDADGDTQVVLMDPDPTHLTDHKDLGGGPTSYDVATHGRDYWLAPGEPHCADCHLPPFVEAQGDLAFPINQRGKYSLFRYAKGHAGLACQACHQSPHGLHPVLAPDVDPVTAEQARSLNADGGAGPVRCAACHGDVNALGVPQFLAGVRFEGVDVSTSFASAAAYMHATAADAGGRGGHAVPSPARR